MLKCNGQLVEFNMSKRFVYLRSLRFSHVNGMYE